MVYKGQATGDDIEILGHVLCPFVCLTDCDIVGQYQKFDVSYKPYWVYDLNRGPD